MAANFTTIKNVDVDVCIHDLKVLKNKESRLKATFDLRYGDVIMCNWKIVLGPKDDRLFMAPASVRGTGGKYYDQYFICEKAARMMIESMALGCYNQAMGKQLYDDYPVTREGEE